MELNRIEMNDLNQLKVDFDVRSYLDDIGIDYYESGDKNVSDGWIGIPCSFCGNDPSWHLGIHYEKGNYFKCWICDESGDIITLIQKLEGVGFGVAKAKLERYQGGIRPEREKVSREYSSILPEGFERIVSGEEPLLVKQWFKRRRFDLSLCQEYRLGWASCGEYQLRLIVPVYLDARLVSFQAVDMTGQARVKYLDCPEDRAVIPNKYLLYGIDGVGEQVILEEGVTDKWRTGRDAVALFTKSWTAQQLALLYEKARNKRVKVALDMDAIRDGEKLAYRLCELFPDVVFVELDEAKDPDQLTAEEVKRMVDY